MIKVGEMLILTYTKEDTNPLIYLIIDIREKPSSDDSVVKMIRIDSDGDNHHVPLLRSLSYLNESFLIKDFRVWYRLEEL